MDWLKLFTLLVAVVSISVHADGPKKKILIHLPQKVKHIHHHKKIYITNHPASSQYAPAFTSSEGTVAVASNILPAVANVMPINSVNLYDDPQTRIPNSSPAASQLLPLYHARGYYGPTPNEIEDSDFDIVPSDSAEYVSPILSSSGVIHSSHPPKRLKIVKLNEPPRKKVIRKVKPKRVIVRNKPQLQSVEGELPVSTFHEQFYSDLDGAGTVRKLRKPPRIEKIVDGDTEHIHTYNEEHIHKVFFDQGPKVAGVIGVDPLTGMSAIATPPKRIIPLKGRQTLVALPSHSFAGIAAVGPVINPATFEYAAYNPHDVTHDHIFHDHGEVPADLEINKDILGIPPKVSYNSQGVRISGTQKKNKNKHSKKVKKPSTDFSYYESIYTSNGRPSKNYRPSVIPTSYETLSEAVGDEYRPVSNFGYTEIHKRPKVRNPIPAYYDTSSDSRFEQASVPTPFDLSSAVLHEYKTKRYPGAGSTRTVPYLKDDYTNNFEYNTYASPSTSEDKNDSGYIHHTINGRKKSISTQNISFGGQDKITWNVVHTDDHRNIDDDDVPTALDDDIFDRAQINNDEILNGSPSQAEQLYSSKAARSLNGVEIDLPDASNSNYRYAEAPPASTPVYISVTTPSNHFSTEYIEASTTESLNTNKGWRHSETNHQLETRDSYAIKDRQRSGTDNRTKSLESQNSIRSHGVDPPKETGKLKYGDKI